MDDFRKSTANGYVMVLCKNVVFSLNSNFEHKNKKTHTWRLFQPTRPTWTVSCSILGPQQEARQPGTIFNCCFKRPSNGTSSYRLSCSGRTVMYINWVIGDVKASSKSEGLLSRICVISPAPIIASMMLETAST